MGDSTHKKPFEILKDPDLRKLQWQEVNKKNAGSKERGKDTAELDQSEEGMIEWIMYELDPSAVTTLEQAQALINKIKQRVDQSNKENRTFSGKSPTETYLVKTFSVHPDLGIECSIWKQADNTYSIVFRNRTGTKL